MPKRCSHKRQTKATKQLSQTFQMQQRGQGLQEDICVTHATSQKRMR